MASGGDRNKQTVILPNPAGRRPVDGQGAPQVPPQQPASPPPQSPPPAGYPPQSPPPAAQQPVTDEWSRDPWAHQGHPGQPAVPAPQPQPSAPGPEGSPVAASSLLRSEAALNANEMLRAAAPMLLMLGKLRSGLVRAQSARIMEDVAHAIQSFGVQMTGSGYSADQAQVAQYALAATADDVVQNIPVDDRRLWTQYSMLSQFFSERIGGTRFFEELARMRNDHVTNVDVLELMYACLAVGFEGVHRTSPNGMATLQQIQRDLYDVIRRVRPRESLELSPRWQGSGIGQQKTKGRVPLWAAASFALALVLFSYMGLRYLLQSETAAVEEELLALYPLAEISLVRPDYVLPVVETPPPPPPLPEPEVQPVAVEPPPPPPPSGCEVVRETLLSDIEGARIDIGECNGELRLTVGDRPGLVLFVSGRADISPDYADVIARIGPALDQIEGKVTVIGHTDSQRYRGVRFGSNFELSVARAEAVAERLRAASSDPGRFQVRGQGANVPIADNGTREGRAQNRRVEIVVSEPT
ncbi:MAG: type IVB secretion system protein IcmH/DotU [Pseudomonadota bacterium]